MIGFHTTFNSAFAGGRDVLAKVEIEKEFERNMENYLPTGEMPEFDAVSLALANGSFSPFEKPISRHYRAGGRIMSLTDKEKNLTLIYKNSENFAFRLIYNGGADEYICLEPQNCAANAPNAPFGREIGGFDYIEPKKSKVFTSKIYIKELEQ